MKTYPNGAIQLENSNATIGQLRQAALAQKNITVARLLFSSILIIL
jgi:hypothetical protein